MSAPRTEHTPDEKCPHCGWTPAEQDALSNHAAEGDRINAVLLAALEEIELHGNEWSAEVARAAIALARGGK